MIPGSRRNIRITLARVSYDIGGYATTDTGIAKIAGTGEILESGEELGAVDLTFWGSTPAQLKMRAKNWPARFDAVQGDYFGVSDAGEHRFDVFLAADRFFRLLDLAHGSRRASIRLSCDVSADGTLDLVHEIEISASRVNLGRRALTLSPLPCHGRTCCGRSDRRTEAPERPGPVSSPG